MTEIGFVRLSATRSVVDTAVTPREAIDLLRRLTSRLGHAFWAEEARLVEAAPARLATARQVTDAHLPELAGRHDGQLVTFDRGVAELAGVAGLVRLLA